MNLEDRLRTALHDVADDTEVTPGSYDRIERRTARARRRRVAMGGGLAAVALVAVAVAGPRLLDGDGESVEVGPASDERETTTTTSTTVIPTDPVAPSSILWPGPGERRFDDPVLLVQAFATEYLGVADPDLVDNGDDTTTVRPRREDGSTPPPDGARTVVEWATYGDDVVVTGASSPNIRVDTPTSGAEIGSPVRVSGQARNLFEANVIVEIRDETGQSVATLPTTAAGSGPELAAYEVEVPFTASGRGAVVVKSDSGIEGTPEATVVPVRFGSPTTGESTEVTVFLQDEQGDFVPVTRLVPRTTGVLRASLEQQLLGAYPGEQARGLTSPFSEDGDQLRGVTISDDGTAVVDLEPGIVDELSGADGAAVLASLDRTVFHFPNVTWVRYAVGGECVSFAGLDTELLCERRSRDEY